MEAVAPSLKSRRGADAAAARDGTHSTAAFPIAGQVIAVAIVVGAVKGAEISQRLPKLHVLLF